MIHILSSKQLTADVCVDVVGQLVTRVCRVHDLFSARVVSISIIDGSMHKTVSPASFHQLHTN